MSQRQMRGLFQQPASAISEAEPQWRIPDKLLFVISVVESGR